MGGTNRVKWVIAGVLVILMVVLLLNRQPASPTDTIAAAPKAPAEPVEPMDPRKQRRNQASADTPQETLRTVQAQYGEQRRKNEQLERDVSRLETLLTEVNTRKQEDQQREQAVNEKFSTLENMLAEIKAQTPSALTDSARTLSEFGFPGGAEGTASRRSAKPGAEDYALNMGGEHPAFANTLASDRVGYRRLQPLTGSPVSVEAVTGRARTGLASRTLTGTSPAAGSGTSGSSARVGQSGPVPTETGLERPANVSSRKKVVNPHLTIPARSQLFDSVAMTALIGRVPVSGAVQDAFPAKFIVGADNMASQGFAIPGVEGVIFDGIARGDWVLSCVSVELTGATFVFDDGTIQHMQARSTSQDQHRDAAGQGANFGRGGDNRVIGWISDTQGVPCIRGERLTNAYEMAGVLGGLGMAKGWSEYKMEAEKSLIVTGGSAVSAVTGDKLAFGRYGMGAAGLNEVLKIFTERFKNTFDAIYVPPGQSVALHITRDLMINHDPAARRVTYETALLDLID